MLPFRSRTSPSVHPFFPIHLSLMLGLMLGLVLSCGIRTVEAFESFEAVRARTVPSEGVIYDRNHKVIQEFRMDHSVRQLEWVPLGLISPALKMAVVVSEDRRFWDHHGVDWAALAKASVQNWLSQNFRGGRGIRGASTISMQLASLLDPHRKLKGRNFGRRDAIQKVKQIQEARELEKQWTKEQILEAYLNLVSFRGELRGIGAASRGLFSKAPHGLDHREAWILAALIRAPASHLSAVEKRACLLGKQISPGFQCDSLQEVLARSSLQPRAIHPQVSLAPHLIHILPLAPQVEVTLESRIQEFVLETLQRQILSIQDKNAHDAAAMVVDNRSGDVLAYVGGVGALSSFPYVDGVRGERQAGSSLKPFLYGMAVDRRYITAGSLIDDSPLDVPILGLGGAVYRPSNYDKAFHGNGITARTALASSLNIPAVKMLNLVGVDSFVQLLNTLGFSGLREADFYGPSLALGSADITLWDLVNAYRVLANQGVWSPLRLEIKAPKSEVRRRVFSKEAAFIVSDILSDRESRSLTFGLENALALKFWTAVKTGTSKDMRDNWCVGFSEHYTVGVWVGNISGEPMWNVTGVTGAAPAWATIMRELHRSRSSHPSLNAGVGAGVYSPRPPQGVVSVQGEWYIQGTEPESRKTGFKVSGSQKTDRTRIVYPVEGMIIARDPDIPTEVQRVFFSSSAHSGATLQWMLNGKSLKFDEGQVSWSPGPSGSYQLSLVDADGKILDSVRFLVR